MADKLDPMVDDVSVLTRELTEWLVSKALEGRHPMGIHASLLAMVEMVSGKGSVDFWHAIEVVRSHQNAN